jgi:hypothetical protein
MTLTMVRKATDFSFVSRLWQEAKAAQPGQGSPCLFCAKPMSLIPKAPALNFEICVYCEMIWLGAAEKAALPARPSDGPVVASLNPRAAEMIARVDSKLFKEKADNAELSEGDWLFWVFGLPTKPGGENWVRFPWMTVTLAFVTLVLAAFHPDPSPDSRSAAIFPAESGPAAIPCSVGFIFYSCL